MVWLGDRRWERRLENIPSNRKNKEWSNQSVGAYCPSHPKISIRKIYGRNPSNRGMEVISMMQPTRRLNLQIGPFDKNWMCVCLVVIVLGINS